MNGASAGKLAKALGQRYGLASAEWLGLRRVLMALDEARAAAALAEVITADTCQPLWRALTAEEWRAVKAHRKAAQREAAQHGANSAALRNLPAHALGNAAARALADEWAPVLGLDYRERRQLSRLVALLGEELARDVLADAVENEEPAAALITLASLAQAQPATP